MDETAAPMPPRYLRQRKPRAFLGLSERTLEKHRTYGTGPTYRKLGGRVVYSLTDLQARADRGLVTSTSDPRGGIVTSAKAAASQGRNAGTSGLR